MNLILKLSRDCAITNSIGAGKLAITETKLYVPVVTLSTQDNTKLPQQLKSVFTRTILWNKYESNIKTFAQNRCLNHLTNPSFQGKTYFLCYYLKMIMIEHHNQLIIFQK